MRAVRDRGGVTVLELLIATAVLGLILAATIAFVSACYQYYASNAAATGLNDSLLTCTTRMQREMRESHEGSVRIFASPPGVVFASPRKADSTISYDPDSLQPVFTKWISYYLEPAEHENLLVRKEHYWDTPTDTPPPVPDEASTAFFQGLGGGSVLASGIESFELESGPPFGFSLLGVSVSYRDSSKENVFKLEIKTKVAFRN